MAAPPVSIPQVEAFDRIGNSHTIDRHRAFRAGWTHEGEERMYFWVSELEYMMYIMDHIVASGNLGQLYFLLP